MTEPPQPSRTFEKGYLAFWGNGVQERIPDQNVTLLMDGTPVCGCSGNIAVEFRGRPFTNVLKPVAVYRAHAVVKPVVTEAENG